ncbi:MAG: hypothetical protein ABFE07_20790 [Armatimonadia bacterium]
MAEKQRKQWHRPEVEEVSLENEVDVLAACWASSNTKQSGTCGSARCAR